MAFHGCRYAHTVHLDQRRKNGWCRGRKSTGSALSFVVTLDCCSTSSCRKESISGAERVTWTLAVSADHLLSPSLSSLVTWSHSRGTWEHPPTSLLSAERMWAAPVIYCFEICRKLLEFICSHNQINTALCVLKSCLCSGGGLNVHWRVLTSGCSHKGNLYYVTHTLFTQTDLHVIQEMSLTSVAWFPHIH